jgi:hypothetical protein
MVFCEVIQALEDKELDVKPTQLRWVINTQKVDRPRMDGSLRFDFSEENVAEIVAYFEKKQSVKA